MQDSSLLKSIEAIVHPLVALKRLKFYENANNQGHFLVIYDIPLLLEYPSNHNVDYTIVVTANEIIQRKRVLNRPGMTEEKFNLILGKQMPDGEKRFLADYLIHTDGMGYAPAR